MSTITMFVFAFTPLYLNEVMGEYRGLVNKIKKQDLIKMSWFQATK